MNTTISEEKNIKFRFGTKAETLKALSSRLKSAVVDEVYYFSVQDWGNRPTEILETIGQQFSDSRYVIVRSSAQGEDGHETSMAGAFHSSLNIDSNNKGELKEAINAVIDSYQEGSENQVLIQPMVTNIAVSGVIMTKVLEDGAPYYCINYDDNSGKTDSITGGTGVHKTLLISHMYKWEYVGSPRIRKMLGLISELEEVIGDVPLDIEFGLTHGGEIHLFQVRPICMYQSWHKGIEDRVEQVISKIENKVQERSKKNDDLYGSRTVLATMPDWNPAEIIGVTPRPLAYSLYRELITDEIWRLARKSMDYRDLPGIELMIDMYGRPYIDVRNSFNSFLPRGLPAKMGQKLVDAWLMRLINRPHLHDKVEFEIVHTCMDFTFEEDFDMRYPGLLSDDEKNIYRDKLMKLTKNALSLVDDGSLLKALKDIDRLAQKQKERSLAKINIQRQDIIAEIASLIDECKELGTLPFSIIARHAFIAESILKSAIKREAISEGKIKLFKMSVETITKDLAKDMEGVLKGEKEQEEFLKRYGHLRPGTYDITSLRYADREDFFKNGVIPQEAHIDEFNLTEYEEHAITELLNETGFDHLSAKGLFVYAKMAIRGREYGKFVFTKNISDILELLVIWGEGFGLDREDLSYLSLPDIMAFTQRANINDKESYLRNLINESKADNDLSKELKLCYIIRDIRDIYVVPLHRSVPNFIGKGKIEECAVKLDASTSAAVDLAGKIVCIENADPGFDWVFTKGIKALITKYGGANSHMAIRCAEFGLPAAIGCGEGSFDRIVSAGMVELNCSNKILKPLYDH